MRIFEWNAKVGGDYVADGYLLAESREKAEEKLPAIKERGKYDSVEIDTDICGEDGCEIDLNGVAIRWEE